MTLAFLTGLLCVAGSFLRLGALADFLSKPILVGFMNGVALSIVLGQIGKLFGFHVEAGRIIPRLLEFLSKLHLTHWPTLLLGLATFAMLAVSPRIQPRVPAALVALAAAATAVRVLGLDASGVRLVGHVPAGLPPVRSRHSRSKCSTTCSRPPRSRAGQLLEHDADRPQLRVEERV